MDKKRARLPAEQAKRLILEAAERHLAERGPDGIRLTDLASELGISHPAILHHFGSRNGLVQAVVEKTTAAMEAEIVAMFTGQDYVGEEIAERAMEGIFALLTEKRLARTLAWLYLSGDERLDVVGHGKQLRRMADLVHAQRCKEGLAESSYEDTLFTIAMVSFTIFGASIASASISESAGVDFARFRRWFTALVIGHLEAKQA